MQISPFKKIYNETECPLKNLMAREVPKNMKRNEKLFVVVVVVVVVGLLLVTVGGAADAVAAAAAAGGGFLAFYFPRLS